MKIWFGQIYIENGVDFPFSHMFQRRLSQEVTALAKPSAKFVEQYGANFELMFRISAKKSLRNNEIKGPTVFKKTKDVEYTVFLPFDVIMGHADAPRWALVFLLKGVCEVFERLEIDKTTLLDRQKSIIDGVCSDPTMLAPPSWNEAENKTTVRMVFTAFFEKNQKV